MTNKPSHTASIPLSKLPADRAHGFLFAPDAPLRREIAGALDLLELRKLRAAIELAPEGKQDWRLTAEWGATVVQACVATLDPITTRIDQTDTILFTAKMPQITESETEMPEDDTLEPLVPVLDVSAIVQEMVSLALPAYPRVAESRPQETVFSEPGITPMSDDDAKPFAGLAGLRDQLKKSSDT